MPRLSAGILVYRHREGRLEVLLVHPGGPFFAGRDKGYWSIPKGEPGREDEDYLATARREFEEETGRPVPGGRLFGLDSIRQKSGKVVHAWAVEGDLETSTMHSNMFEMRIPFVGRREWPEVDQWRFFGPADAREHIKETQIPLLERLEAALKASTAPALDDGIAESAPGAGEPHATAGAKAQVEEVPAPLDDHVVAVRGAAVVRGGTTILDGVDWLIRPGERWVVLGPNGSGKTTLVAVASTYLWPSSGTVSVLGRELGSVDVRELRRHIGIVSSALEARIPHELTASEIVVAGASGALAPWWDRPDDRASARVPELLELVGCTALADRPFELLSSGERQRVQIARALALDPALLLLDEPFAGLDLGAREELASLLERLYRDSGVAAAAVVTHHVEEIAPGTTHALLLRGGRIVASGPVGEVVTGPILTEAFGLPLSVHHSGSRFTAHAAGDRA